MSNEVGTSEGCEKIRDQNDKSWVYELFYVNSTLKFAELEASFRKKNAYCRQKKLNSLVKPFSHIGFNYCGVV